MIYIAMSKQAQNSEADFFKYVLQHGEPVLHHLGVATTRHTGELNHALNQLERKLNQLAEQLDSDDEKTDGK